ncbi:MAG: CubicO group peptidase (beta-lactamase class C family) [Myxococcota bacterium]
MILMLSLTAHADLDAVLDAVADDHSGVVHITQGDAVLRSVSHGRRAPEDAAPPGADAVVWTGSISKQFTAVAAMVLVDAGKLSRDQSVASIFEELPDDALTLDGEVCTVARLLQATCGIPRVLGSPLKHADLATDHDVQERFLADLAGGLLLFAPGSARLYSNAGYDLAGLMVERVAGQPVFDVLAPLLERAGMTATGTDPDTLSDFDARISWGQLYLGGWRWAGRWARLGPRSPTRIGASGNVFSTASDLVRWTRALHSGALLSAESLTALTTVGYEDYAMGLVVEGEPGERVIWHNGALEPHSYSTATMWLEASDTTIVILNNQSMSLPAGNASALMRQLEEALTGDEGDLARLTTTTRDRRMASLQSAISTLIGPGLLLASLISVWRTPKRGRLSWAGSGVSLALGAVLGLTIFSPLLPSVLGLLVIPVCVGLVTRLRKSAEQPLTHPEHRLSEGLNITISVFLIVFFTLAPMAGPQVRWTAAALVFVVGVELWRAR